MSKATIFKTITVIRLNMLAVILNHHNVFITTISGYVLLSLNLLQTVNAKTPRLTKIQFDIEIGAYVNSEN